MWARIVLPCTILASGFVRTKPAYLQPFSALMLRVCPALRCGYVLHYRVGHPDITVSDTPILSYRTLRYYRIGYPDMRLSCWPIEITARAAKIMLYERCRVPWGVQVSALSGLAIAAGRLYRFFSSVPPYRREFRPKYFLPNVQAP